MEGRPRPARSARSAHQEGAQALRPCAPAGGALGYTGAMESHDVTRDERYAARWARWTAPLRARPGATRALGAANRALTALFYGAYPVLLAWAAATDATRAIAYLAAPAVGFVAVSLFRRAFDAPRPYEREGIAPLISRDGAGRSFPSRHAFSAFAIASCWTSWCPPVGAALLALAAALGACRVLGGVHYPRDVIAGALVGLLCGVAAALVS